MKDSDVLGGKWAVLAKISFIFNYKGKVDFGLK